MPPEPQYPDNAGTDSVCIDPLPNLRKDMRVFDKRQRLRAEVLWVGPTMFVVEFEDRVRCTYGVAVWTSANFSIVNDEAAA